MKYEKSCGCIIFNNNKELLLIHQVKGHWGLPKGHIEKNETEVQTAIREVKEETNIDVKVYENKKYSMKYIINDDIEKEVVFFIADKIKGEIIVQKEEVIEARWLKIDDAIECITYDNSKDLLRKVKKDLKL